MFALLRLQVPVAKYFSTHFSFKLHARCLKMEILKASLVSVVMHSCAAAVHSCVIDKPNPGDLTSSFVIANAIDESNSTSLMALLRFLNIKDKDFAFPKLLHSAVFILQSGTTFKGPGFCDGDKKYEQVIFTVEVTSPVEAILYGCSLLTGKDVQIIIYDAETHLFGGSRIRQEGINRDMNWAFCTCHRMIEAITGAPTMMTSLGTIQSFF